MNEYAFSLNYKYINGKNNYYKDPHGIRDRILPFSVAVSVLEGEFYVDFEGDKTVCVKPGETIFIKSFLKHSLRMNAIGKLIHSHFLCSYATIDVFSAVKEGYFVTDSAEIQDILYKLNLQVYTNSVAQKFYTDQMLSRLYLEFFNLNIIDPKKLFIEPWLNSALEFIQANFCGGVTVEEVIDNSGFSKNLFYKMFKSKMKVNPRDYIEAERLRTATMLLLEGKKVKEVAGSVGFNDVSYFNKVFKRKYGVTPGEYKKENKLL